MPKARTRSADPVLVARTFRRRSGAAIEYLLHQPADPGAGAAALRPLIVFLHGAGERGRDVWRAARHGPFKFIRQHPGFPFLLIAPLCPPREGWSNAGLHALLDEVSAEYPVDATRVYLTGLSMGGYGVWDLALTEPERFAAVAPICGGGSLISVLLTRYDDRAEALRSLPVWAFHGGRDDVVPPAESRRTVRLLREYGCREVKLTVYPDAGHDSWTRTYDDPRLYEWFLAHERNSRLTRTR